ncbi:MAG: tetratricopeptide repeat protein [Gammaproteobacteria bacterium]
MFSTSTEAKERAFPGTPDTRFVADLKRDADRAYDRGDYARAYRILTKSLVWRGDKYAQYLLGVMYLNGQGVRADPARGVAWLQLAAERGNPKLMAAYRDADERINDGQRARSNQLFDEFANEYGDRRVLARLIRKDSRALRRATGSRVGATDNLPLTIVRLDGSRVPGDQFYGSIRERMNTRLDYLGGVVELGEFVLIDDDEETENSDEE